MILFKRPRGIVVSVIRLDEFATPAANHSYHFPYPALCRCIHEGECRVVVDKGLGKDAMSRRARTRAQKQPIGVASKALCIKIMRLRRSTFVAMQVFDWARTFARLSLSFVRGKAFMCVLSSHHHACNPKKSHGRDSRNLGTSRFCRSKIR